MNKKLALSLLVLSAIVWDGCRREEEEVFIPEMSATSSITDAQNCIYTVGFEQVSPDNQNPFVEKRQNGQLLWRLSHENTPVDGQAVWVDLDENQQPWVVFTVDGGSSSSDYITRREVEADAFSNVFLSSYGRGGGAKVAVIARLNPANGKIVKGTFVTARTNEGNANSVDETNSLEVTRFGVDKGILAFEANSWFKPFSAAASESNYRFHPDATDANKTGDHWRMLVTMPSDLSKVSNSTILK